MQDVVSDSDNRRTKLFGTYVQRMFQRPRKGVEYEEEKTRRWLTYLASNMQKHGQTIFQLENLQPSWLLSGKGYWLYIMLSRFFGSLLLLSGLAFVPIIVWFGESPVDFATLEFFLPYIIQVTVLAVIPGAAIGLVDGFSLLLSQKGSQSSFKRICLNILTVTTMTTCLFMMATDFHRLYRQPSPSTIFLFFLIIFSILFGIRKFFGIWKNKRTLPQDAQPIEYERLLWKRFGLIKRICLNILTVTTMTTCLFMVSAHLTPVYYFIPGGRLPSLSFTFMFFLVCFGLFFGVKGSTRTLTQDIQPIEDMRLLWKRFGLILLCGVLLGAEHFLLSNGDSLAIFWLVLAFFLGVPLSLQTNILEEAKSRPNEGMWRSLKNSWLSGLGIGFYLGCIFLFVTKQQNAPLFNISPLAAFDLGLLCGLPFAMWFGLLDFLQHFTLRFVLWLYGYAPWNYARFLDHATDRIFLRKVGGGYIFVHRLLLEYFAAEQAHMKLPAPTTEEQE